MNISTAADYDEQGTSGVPVEKTNDTDIQQQADLVTTTVMKDKKMEEDAQTIDDVIDLASTPQVRFARARYSSN